MADILIFGENGQVGQALKARLKDRAIVATREEADFMQPEKVVATLERHKPKVILNASAYTAVDLAESNEIAAMQVNGLTPGIIAEYASKNDALLIHYSTDYVFDGSGTAQWKETDKTAPLSAYGRTKLLGEQEIAKSGCRHFIFRLCWVYDENGKNFLNTMLRLGGEREALSVVADQIGAPTYAGDIADASIAALHTPDAANGIYHFCNAGETSWHGFANAIFDEARTRNVPLKVNEVKQIATADYPTPAKRPLNSRMDTAKFRKAFGVETIPGWQDALSRVMTAKFGA